jgi:malonyl-ACP decarboxylase
VNVVATGCGAVSCAGVGIGRLRDALYDSPDFERRIMYSIADAAAIYPICPLDAARGVTLLGLPNELSRAVVRAGHRAGRALQASLLAVAEAWHHAQLTTGLIPSDRISLVIGGSNLSQIEHAALSRGEAIPKPSWAVQFLDTDHVGVLSTAFGIRGEGFTVGAASASGNVALVQAHRLIASGGADVCVVVGALMGLSAAEFGALQAAGAMAVPRSMDDPCNFPFDGRRCGFVYGEGAGCVIIESERSARSRGREPLATLAAATMQMHGERFAAPSADGEAIVMANAIKAAGLVPADIDYVNAHGTGSAIGDDTEIAAISRVFGRAAEGPLINSTKSIIGHTLSAAGTLESIAVLIQLEQGWIHATRNLQAPISDEPRLVRERTVPKRLRYALSNSFAFGGINTSVLWKGVEL